MVRQGSVVSLATAAWLALAALASGVDIQNKKATAPKAASSTKAKPAPAAEVPKPSSQSDPIDMRPYKIRAWVVIAPDARLDAQGRQRLLAAWRSLVRRFVGAPWDLEIADGDGPLATETLDDLKAKTVRPLAAGCDKAWIIVVEPGTTGFVFTGREYDVLTVRVGATCRRAAPHPTDAPRALFSLSLDLFAPTAEIGGLVGGGVRIRVRGSSLPASSPVGQVVEAGTVFRPLRIFQKPDGTVTSIEDIRRSYLRVVELEGSQSRCDIISSLRDPLSRRTARKNMLVAVGLKPPSIPTRLHYIMGKDKKPASGFRLTAKSIPDGTIRDLGTTDREGRIVLRPGFASSLVILRLLAADMEPLDEMPCMPGETLEERTVLVNPKPETVALETELNALRDELIDLVAVRARIESRLKARADGEKWDEVEELLQEFRKLTPREKYVTRLAKLKEDATRRQAETKSAILTKTAMALITDTQALIDRYLDDEIFKAYDKGLEEAKAELAKADPSKKAAAKPGLPVARTTAATAPAEAPAPAPASAPVTRPIPRRPPTASTEPAKPEPATPKPEPPAPATPPRPAGNLVPF